MPEAYICDAVRTPIGRYGGVLANVRTDDLAAAPIKALIDRNPQVDWSRVGEVYLGCANQAGEDNRNVARMASLLAGLPETVGGVTLNRLCASGLEAVASAARAIRSGDLEVAIAGGVDIDDPSAVRDGQGGATVFAFGRDVRHHDRLAVRQPADQEPVWRSIRCPRPGKMWPRRFRLPGPTRMPSHCARSSGPALRSAPGFSPRRLSRSALPRPVKRARAQWWSGTSTRGRTRPGSVDEAADPVSDSRNGHSGQRLWGQRWGGGDDHRLGRGRARAGAEAPGSGAGGHVRPGSPRD